MVLESRWRARSSSQSYQNRMNEPSTPHRKNSFATASTLPSSASTP